MLHSPPLDIIGYSVQDKAKLTISTLEFSYLFLYFSCILSCILSSVLLCFVYYILCFFSVFFRHTPVSISWKLSFFFIFLLQIIVNINLGLIFGENFFVFLIILFSPFPISLFVSFYCCVCVCSWFLV